MMIALHLLYILTKQLELIILRNTKQMIGNV
jgi:hypothetical protein